MTVGNPLKQITLFAIPLFIGNIFQMIYNVVDSAVVGRFVGSDQLAAVGTCSGAFNLLTSLIIGLTGGMAVLISQYFGAQNFEKVRKTVVSGIMIVLAAGVLLTVAGMFLAGPLLRATGVPENIFEDAKLYLTIMFAGMLANCLYNGVSALLRALGDSIVPLLILVLSSLLNVGLDLLFVLAFHMGVAGVAIATVLAQMFSAIVCIIYAFAKVSMIRFKRSEFVLDKEIAKDMLKIGVTAALSSAGVSISVMFMQRAINAYGSDVMAGYTIGNKVENACFCLSYAIGMATGTFCGQNIGARNMERVKKGMRSGTLLSWVYTLLMVAIVYLFATPITKIFNTEPVVVDLALEVIYITTAFAPILGMIFIYQNVLRSAKDITPTVWMSVIEIGARSVLAFLFSWLWGYHGIWWVTPIGWVTVAVVGFLRYRSGKWKIKSGIMENAI